MTISSKHQLITYLILLILLVADFLNSLLGVIYRSSISPVAKEVYANRFEFWAILLYGFIYFGSFPLIAVVIRLNQDHLQRLNLDKLSVLMTIVAGLIVLYTLPYNCFVGLALIYTIYILFNKKVGFGVINQYTLRMILLITVVFAVIMIGIISFGDTTKVGFLQIEELMRRFLREVIPLSIYEEVLFRGMLYMFLKDLGLSESRTLYTQAFLSWITHINYLPLYPVVFFTITPIFSLTLGYLAYRAKSITPSLFAHLLYNILVEFTRLLP